MQFLLESSQELLELVAIYVQLVALLLRISELEQQAGGNAVLVATDATNWKERALQAERKLLQVREALDLILKGTAKLNEAIK